MANKVSILITNSDGKHFELTNERQHKLDKKTTLPFLFCRVLGGLIFA